MIDVIKIAAERRVMLAAELAKLDSFIRMAHALVKHSQGLGRDPLIDTEVIPIRALPADLGGDGGFIREDVNVLCGRAVVPVGWHHTEQPGIRNHISALRYRIAGYINELQNARKLAIYDQKTAPRSPVSRHIALVRLWLGKIANAIKADLASRKRIKRRFNELKNARRRALGHDQTVSGYFDFNNIASAHLWRRGFAARAYSNLLAIGQPPGRADAQAPAAAIEGAVAVEGSARNAATLGNATSRSAQDNTVAPASAASPSGVDQFTFNEEAPEDEDELVLIGAPTSHASSVDAHVGQRLRQRRWMMAITQKQLGDLVGVTPEQIQKYECGAIHISTDRMWDIAEAMDVPMSYFFEGIEDQAPGTGEATDAVLETVTVEGGARNTPFQSEAAQNDLLARANAAFRAGPDHLTFNGETSVHEDELVLVGTPANKADPVDVHVGQRLRQRRWMMGLTQQQLGDLVGVELELIRQYETGQNRISAGRMWDVAVAMEVPVSFFFEGLEGQAQDSGEALADILDDKEADELVRAYRAIPADQRQQLFDLARELSEAA